MKFVSESGRHNSIYCSIGEWNTHITDLLSDTSHDNFIFQGEKYNKALFRYYTRVLLITSEILTDFEDLIKFLHGINRDSARNLLSIPGHPFDIQELMEYINNICKHKIGRLNDVIIPFKYHCYNHHIDYVFLDAGKSVAETVNINNLTKFKGSEKLPIEVISLNDIISSILYGYRLVDEILDKGYDDVKTKLKRFEN